MTSPVIDGYATGMASGTTTQSAALTTTTSNDIIVVATYASTYGNSNPGVAVSGVAASGLTFTKRVRSHVSQCGGLELWWAVAASPLTAATITVTYAAAFDDACVVAFGVAGCHTAAPWDGNSTLPANNGYAGPSTGAQTAALTGSTSSADDLLLMAVGAGRSASSTQFTVAPTGFTLVASKFNGGGSGYGGLGIAAEAVSAVQTGVTVTWGSSITDDATTSAAGSSLEYVLDALTADTAGGSAAPPAVFVIV